MSSRIKHCELGGWVILLLGLYTNANANSQTSSEGYFEARAKQVVNKQTGVFDRLAGEYRGSYKGEDLIVWLDSGSLPLPEGVKDVVALLIFKKNNRRSLADYLKKITDNPDVYYRKVCKQAVYTEYGYNFPDFYKIWDTGGGLVLLQDSFNGEHLPFDWKQITSHSRSRHLINEEYISLHKREYAVKKIRRVSATGELDSIELTRTGFIQNPFDNPVIHFTRTDKVTSELKLLEAYLESKFNARKALGIGGTEWNEKMPDVCKVG